MKNNNRTEKILYIVISVLVIITLLLVFIKPKNNINNEITNIVLERKEISLVVGDKYNLGVITSPSNVKGNLSFSSSNPNVAIVDSEGHIEAIGVGRATIKVTSSNGISRECNLHVSEKEILVDSIELDKNDIQINVGETYIFKTTLLPTNTTEHEFIWESSNPDVVSVSNGKVTGLKHGSALITVKTKKGKIAICDIEVGISIESITIKEKNITIAIGETYKLDPLVKPTNRTEKLSYISSDSSILSVSNDGIITANKMGEATITVKSPSGVKASIKVNTRAKGTQVTSALNNSLNTNNFDLTSKVLLFGSDYQHSSNRKKNFTSILNNIKNNNINPGLISILGDYQDSGTALSGSESGLKDANQIIKSVFPNSGALYIQGNHDPANNKYLTKTGGYEANNYIIYAINEDDFPSSSSTSNSRVNNVASKLDSYLKNMVDWNAKKPVFVITHVPLHKTSRNDNKPANILINVLNKYGDKLDIIFMFGHNHSGEYDNCNGGSINFIKKGDKLTYATGTNTIKFTYMNAGYVGWAANTNGEVRCGSEKKNSTNMLTMSVFKIEDKTITIERYSRDAKVFSTTINRIN